MRITPAQMAYINSLYETLDIGYKDRQKPETAKEASALIVQLKSLADDRVDAPDTDDEF